MKAIGFFLTVFLSMLAVFLVATGEVKRWFTPEASVPALELGQVKVVDQRKPGAGNIFEFPFYDVDRAELKFVIRAEFIQDELGVSSQIDKIDHLTLRNGVIEVPLADGGGESADRAVDEVRQRTGGQANRLLLEFQTASYERGQKDPSGKSGLAVFLKNGKGTTDDGTQFFFEELAFGNKGPDVYYLRSQKPVSIRGQAFGVLSPTGLDGTLRQRTHQDKSAAGAPDPLHQELLLLPPVSALLHPEASLAAFDPGKKGSAKPEPAATTPPKEGGRVVGVTSQGPLSIVTQDGAQGTASRVEITFEKDVAVYPAPEGATLETLPAPQGSRFDCQKLTVQLETVHGRTEPVRAVATWEGGRVRAHFASSRGGEQPFVIEGDLLEWNRKPAEPPAGEEAAAHVGRGNLLDGVAVLQGKPILRTRGLELLAERTSYFPAEGKLWLSKVSGTLEYLGGEEKEGRHSKKPTEEKLGNLGVGAPGPGPGPAASGDGVGSPPPARAPGSVAARVPQFWDLGADEAEIYFSDAVEGEGRTAGERIFSRLVARSERSDGVRVASRGERSYQAVGAHLTYNYGDKKATLEGTPQDRPRFTSGDNWIEAVKIHVFQEERAVWFEDEVLARVDDLSTLRLLAREGDAAQEGKAPRAQDRQAAENDGLEISAAFLAVRFREESSADAATPLRDLVATGTRERPVSLTTLSTPWCRFSGRELHWDQEKETARLRGAAGAGAVPLSSQAPEELARIQVDGGEILAPDLVFHQKTWKAYLGDTVLLKSARQDAQRGRPVIQVETGKAEVELYRGLASEGPKRAGQLGELGRVRSLKATHPANGAIVVSGAVNGIPYSGKAEEATWTQETRVFRLHGTNFQEVVLEAEGLHGPTLAREILFDESQSLVTLRGDVRGTLVQKQGLTPARSAEQETGTEKPREVTWTFETNALEAKVIPATGTTPAALESLRARDKVDLRCDDLGIQLRGDDMIYEEATHKVRVFSPDGRPQTLVCDATRIGPSRAEVGAEASPPAPAPAPAEGRPSDSPSEKVHKVVAQEISLLLYRDPYAVEQRGEIANWLLVELEKDVIASFYIPGKKDDSRKASAVGEIWKMVAERLTLFVDPAQGLLGGNPSVARKAVPWAAANGKVVFTTGTLQATADRAIYQESSSRVTLYGSPARLSKDNEPVFAEPEISVWREDGSFGARYSKGDGRAPRAPAIPAPTGNKPSPGPEPRR